MSAAKRAWGGPQAPLKDYLSFNRLAYQSAEIMQRRSAVLREECLFCCATCGLTDLIR